MRRLDLVPDCASCVALCCVATSFEASDDFAFDKPAGVPCRHLTRDHRCSIHAERGLRGLVGCTLYHCYGAGQRVTRALEVRSCTPAERDERFLRLRAVHELLWLLDEAAKLCPPSAAELAEALVAQAAALEEAASDPHGSFDEGALRVHHDAAHELLRRLGDALGGRAALSSARGEPR
jgi:hypothetical protein